MDPPPSSQQLTSSTASTSDHKNINKLSHLKPTPAFTQLTSHRLHTSPTSPLPSQNIFQLSKMSGSDSSSTKWDDILKHGSALSIVRPDVVFTPYGGGSSSGSSSGGSSSNSSGGSSSGGK
ncbi:hypothetical protein QC762_0101320 [Podospora pseudocomata]|nr:hypothetical protein QC762_0101320 [Podospora pseudocomata]KAK4671893.1 hypothetical protein QC764_0099910 [Podospora pseudoanserina]